MGAKDVREISRRRLLGTAGAAGAAGLVAGAAGGAAGYAAADGSAPAPLTSVGATAVPFHGTAAAPEQAGITTALPPRGQLIAFDLAPGAGRKEAIALPRRWSGAAEAMTAGRAPDGDDQIALDAGPASLTVTFGFGHGFFGRTGLADRVPADFVAIPPFSQDALVAADGGGDLWVQIGADDPLVAFHALRVLQREATTSGTATTRWQMNGFSRTPGATARPMTVRNLMGQVDGTNNPKPTDGDFRKAVFVSNGSGPTAWLNGGSYAVVRRIRMLLDPWESQSLTRQEAVIGRRKSDGAPLSGGTETTTVNLQKVNADGSLAIAGDAHIRVAAAQSNDGAKMLRRPFSYHDGFDADGTPNAGLLFIAWQAAPLNGFIRVQRKLDSADALSRFIRHESSAVFAVPPAARPGEYVGQSLLEG
jgi:dye decolorizing peroxidase